MDLDPGVSVMGAVYPRRDRALPEPIVIGEADGGVSWDWEDGELHDVHFTGTGFTCYRLDDFDKIRDDLIEYKYEGPQHDGRVGPCWLYCGPTRDGILVTDDGYLGNVCVEHDLRWVVHGGVVCDQIDLDGHIYRVDDAKPKGRAATETVAQAAYRGHTRSGACGARQEATAGEQCEPAGGPRAAGYHRGDYFGLGS